MDKARQDVEDKRDKLISSIGVGISKLLSIIDDTHSGIRIADTIGCNISSLNVAKNTLKVEEEDDFGL